MSAERGWILDPHLSVEGRDSHWSQRRVYYILPDDPVAALNILREAAGMEPWRDDDEVGGDGQDDP